MKFKDLKFAETKIPKGKQALVQFGDYELSIVCNENSYGGKNGGTLYEIAVFDKNDTLIEMPGITEKGDTVKGWLNETNVEGILKKMYALTMHTGKNNLT